MNVAAGEGDWRCVRCGLLLGVRAGREIECRYKDVAYVIEGRVRAWCRRCGAENETSTTGGESG